MSGLPVLEMVRGLVRCAELREAATASGFEGLLWDDESRRALEAARDRGWGKNRIGTLIDEPAPPQPPETSGADSTEPPEPAVLRVLRERMRDELAQPLTTAHIHVIQQLAVGASNILLALNPKGAVRHRRRRGILYTNPMYAGGEVGEEDAEPPEISNPQETFGANMMRELVGALPQLFQTSRAPAPLSIESLVFAISAAKNNNLTEVAARLTKELEDRLAQPTPTQPAQGATP